VGGSYNDRAPEDIRINVTSPRSHYLIDIKIIRSQRKEMRKLFIATLIIAASLSVSFGQSQQEVVQNNSEIPNMGRAPKEINGVGRLDLRVEDENGNPIKGAFAKLNSVRTDGFLCETWNTTDARGVAVLPPLHMGKLQLVIKAKGFETLKLEIPLDKLSQPVEVTMHKK
jgi:hypothetical protein